MVYSLKPIEDYKLYVIFDDDKSVVYDVGEDIKQIPDFAPLKNETIGTPIEGTVTKDDINDYDEYERLPKSQREAIKAGFSSPIAYTAWLRQLIQNRTDKLTEGAIGYGDQAIAE